MKINIAIIGGGVAGLSSAIYALRANADVTIYEQGVIGGLTTTIDKIDNYPSYTTISGWELADNMYQQAKKLGLVVKYQQVVSVTRDGDGILVNTAKDSMLYDSVVVATGTRHNKLGIDTEEPLVGRGISYCATCDGNFYRDKVVAVVGSGNSAVKEALYLSGIASKVLLISPHGALEGDNMAISQLSTANVEMMYDTSVVECVGQDVLTDIVVANNITNATTTITLSGLFVAVGSKPASEVLTSAGVVMDKGFVVADDTMMTSIEGIFVAGDLSNGKLKQIVTACGDGALAGNYACVYARKSKALASQK